MNGVRNAFAQRVGRMYELQLVGLAERSSKNLLRVVQFDGRGDLLKSLVDQFFASVVEVYLVEDSIRIDRGYNRGYN